MIGLIEMGQRSGLGRAEIGGQLRGDLHDDLGEVGQLLLGDARGRPGDAEGSDHLSAVIMDGCGDATHAGKGLFIIDRVAVGAHRAQMTRFS